MTENSEGLKKEFSKLMHEMIHKNKHIMESADYRNLCSLCEQDITLLSCIKNQEQVTAKEISEYLKVPKTTIVTAAVRLESRGYLERVPNERDRREKFLVLTEKGKKTNEEHEGYENAILDALTGLWSEDDQVGMMELMAKRKELK